MAIDLRLFMGRYLKKKFKAAESVEELDIR